MLEKVSLQGSCIVLGFAYHRGKGASEFVPAIQHGWRAAAAKCRLDLHSFGNSARDSCCQWLSALGLLGIQAVPGGVKGQELPLVPQPGQSGECGDRGNKSCPCSTAWTIWSTWHTDLHPWLYSFQCTADARQQLCHCLNDTGIGQKSFTTETSLSSFFYQGFHSRPGHTDTSLF